MRSSWRALSLLLWREREVLDQARNGGRPEALRGLRSLELHRAITTREVGLELGYDAEPTLRQLIDWAPTNWAAVFSRHLSALDSLAGDVGPDVQRSLRDFLA